MVESNPVVQTGTTIEPDATPPTSTFLRQAIVLALAIGLGLRLIGLHSPPYDNHGFRQCQTLSTIEDFYRNGIDFLHPRTLYMGYPGVMVLELPLFQALGAAIYRCFGPHLEYIRILNIIFGALTTIVFYRMLLLWFDRAIARLAAVIYWLAPLNIFYQRSPILDPMAVLFALLSFYALAQLLATTHEGADAAATHKRPWIFYFLFAFATLVTVLIKALYLWPTVLLFGQAFLARGLKFDRLLFRTLAVFAVTGICFIGWNRYAAQVNATNSLASGLKPTSLLGFSRLLDIYFYSLMLKGRPKVWLGLLGGVFYLFGVWAWWSERRIESWRGRLFLVLCIPPTYLLAFPFINYPHDYYQLIIAPFLAITSATGVVWLARKIQSSSFAFPALNHNILAFAVSVLAIVAVFNYTLWFKGRHIDSRTLAFERLCAGTVEPWAPAILFGTPEATGMEPSHTYQLPQFLYAGKLWGYGCSVPDAASAKETFETVRKSFQRLDYVIFYGTELPKWVSNEGFQLVKQDDSHGLFVFESKRKPGSMNDR